jgi:hypothetical protein
VPPFIFPDLFGFPLHCRAFKVLALRNDALKAELAGVLKSKAA